MSELRGIIAITDRGWYDFLHEESSLDEVNFWKPSSRRGIRAEPFTPFLFKLRAPDRAICGFGYFARYARLPAWMAWETFGRSNGCATFAEMQERITRIRGRIRYQEAKSGPDEIGCVLIAQPVFFPEDRWVAQPRDWPVRTQTDKRYSLVEGEGARVWQECLAVANGLTRPSVVAEGQLRYGDPVLVRPRIGQGIFRVSIHEAYSGACAMTGEHSLPALEASHIKPFGDGGPNDVPNGLLMRADLHRLFDRGYLTVTPDARIEVSGRLREDYHNGRSYYPIHGEKLRLPRRRIDRPAREFLEWHNDNVFVA
jgi:putative restriction endonuclease